jgi:hypothetical protein
MGISNAIGEVEVLELEALEGTVGRGVIMTVTPSGAVVVKGVVMPVGSVISPSLLEITVKPSASVVVSAVWIGVIVIEMPSGSVVTIGVVTPVGSVSTPSLFEIIVCPAEFVVVRAMISVLEDLLELDEANVTLELALSPVWLVFAEVRTLVDPLPDGANVMVSPPVVIVVALDKPVGSVTTMPLSEITV